MCVDLIYKLKNDFPNIGLIFALADEKTNSYYIKQMKIRIKDLRIESNFYFLTGQKEIWPLFKHADLMVRPTNTDGDAISIREALYFKVPVVASDVTLRPNDCYLFKNRDINELYNQCKIILNRRNNLNS